MKLSKFRDVLHKSTFHPNKALHFFQERKENMILWRCGEKCWPVQLKSVSRAKHELRLIHNVVDLQCFREKNIEHWPQQPVGSSFKFQYVGLSTTSWWSWKKLKWRVKCQILAKWWACQKKRRAKELKTHRKWKEVTVSNTKHRKNRKQWR